MGIHIPAAPPVEEVAGSSERIFRGLVQCLSCSARMLFDVGPHEYLMLRQNGKVTLSCERCGTSTRHRLVRMVA